MHWEIELLGDAETLQMLSESAQSGNYLISNKEDKYILRALRLDDLQDYDEVYTHAKEIVKCISGASRIILGAYQPIKIGSLKQFQDDGTIEKVFLAQAESSNICFRAFSGGDAPDLVKDWLAVSEKDLEVAKALRLRDLDDLNWVELYRIYEVIEGDYKKNKKKKHLSISESGWITEPEIRLFKHTANSVEASGDRARHGKETTQPPPNPMTLVAARLLVDRLLQSWIASKTSK
jgi:hypothetical protein